MQKQQADKLSTKQKKARIAAGRTEPWEYTIYGSPQSKSNNRKIVRYGGVSRLIKSDAAQAYLKQFLEQCPTLDPLFEGDVQVEMMIYYGSRRPDLDASLIADALQLKVYRNDRQIRRVVLQGAVDTKCPRTIIRITTMA